ncbi:MAG: FAD-dependent monooxygenase [Planctomycetes bacterium]|nr:FAD-dependent monooxygenase [Planctomycetota bacterium]
MSNPLGSLATVRCEPWHYQDKVVLIGDAAHAVVPFYGQGINAGFEDCRILDACLRQHPSDRAGALRQFTVQRKINTDAIADLALANFIEMRDKVGSPAFLMKKKLEKTLHAFFPKWFMPLYNMISFSDIPYAEARAKAEAQWKTIKLVAGIGAILILIVIVFAFIQLT